MRIETVEREGCAILRLKGDFDTFQCPVLEDALGRLKSRGIVRVGLDARLLSFANSTALGTILRARRTLASSGGELVLVRPSPFLRGLLAKVGLERVLRVLEEEDEAFSHLARGPRDPLEGEALDEEAAAIAALVRGAFDRLDPGYLFFAPGAPEARRALGRSIGVARLLEVREEEVEFAFRERSGKVGAERARAIFAPGTAATVKFRLPLYRPEGFFEIPVRVEKGERARDGSVRVRARFDSIPTADREAIRQFVADIRYLKGEVSDARSPSPSLTPSRRA
ncbi:MAG: STAS domain-containing protein [Planctomycetota bacterium]